MQKHKVTALHICADPKLTEGNGPVPQNIVLLTFPNHDAAERWYSDPEIADLRVLRQDAGEKNIFLL